MRDDLPPDFDINKAMLPEANAVFEAVTRRPPLPALLYHYTSADGLLGIMRTEALWATNARYMNDASEIVYGRDLVCSIVHDVAAAHSGGVHKWLSEFETMIRQTHDTNDTYIASFCEGDDLLSQWRAYGSGRGFALAFHAPPLSRLPGTMIFRVEYHRPTQEKAVRDTLRVHVDAFHAAVAAGKSDKIPQISAGLGLLLALWVVAFKHPTFSEEREWRLAPFQAGPPRVRSDHGWLRPYVEVSIRESPEMRMPLHHIKHGPSPQPELDKRAIELLLQDTTYFGLKAKCRSGA
jgi:DUF2971 family protein